jgi:hypothetical protein
MIDDFRKMFDIAYHMGMHDGFILGLLVGSAVTGLIWIFVHKYKSH